MTDQIDDVAVDEAVRATVAPRTGGRTYQGTWQDIVSRRPVAGRRNAVARFVIPAAAAAVVLGIVAAVVLSSGPGTGRAPSVGAPPATVPHRSDPVYASAEAVAALNRLAAAAASTAPVPLKPGQLIYVHSVGFGSEFGDTPTPVDGIKGLIGRTPQDHQMWVDPQGMILLKTVLRTGNPLTVQPGPPSLAAEIETARSDLAAHGPSFTHPTPAWLDSLETDPEALIQHMRKMADPNSPWSDDHQVFTYLAFAFWHFADAVVPTPARVALLQAMQNLTGLTSSTVTVDGRTLVAIRQTEDDPTASGTYSASELLFDPATGHCLGNRDIDVPTGQATYQLLWTPSIVDSIDQTGP